MLPTELILNPDGSVYHLHLRPEHIAKDIIAVGDPDRVTQVSQYFDTIEHKIQHREFVTHTGTYKGKPLSVISTGIGTDNIDIVLNELDFLVNMNLQTLEPLPQTTSLNIVRVGTSGTLQKDIPVDSFLVSENAIGLDGLGFYYPNISQNPEEALFRKDFLQKFQKDISLPFEPYFASASHSLLEKFLNNNNENNEKNSENNIELLKGNTLTCAGFYAPQGRNIRIQKGLDSQAFFDRLQNFEYEDKNLTQNSKKNNIQKPMILHNFEMETAGYYLLGEILGHNVLSLNAILANRATAVFSKKAQNTVEKLIKFTLEKMKQPKSESGFSGFKDFQD